MSEVRDLAGGATAYFRDLQGRVCAAFEAFEPASRFEARRWTKPEGHRLQGGGDSRLMRGSVFEKVGVNVSHVWGVLPSESRAQVAGSAESEGRFSACGISLVAHMTNPYVPAVHMNLRYLCTSRAWFGGGSDLTPTFAFPEDTPPSRSLRAACDGYRADAYAQFKPGATGTSIAAPAEPRGVGGIFFDDLAVRTCRPTSPSCARSGGVPSVYPQLVRRRRTPLR
jgi:coproporphyrinogen III oxidase